MIAQVTPKSVRPTAWEGGRASGEELSAAKNGLWFDFSDDPSKDSFNQEVKRWNRGEERCLCDTWAGISRLKGEDTVCSEGRKSGVSTAIKRR